MLLLYSFEVLETLIQKLNIVNKICEAQHKLERKGSVKQILRIIRIIGGWGKRIENIDHYMYL